MVKSQGRFNVRKQERLLIGVKLFKLHTCTVHFSDRFIPPDGSGDGLHKLHVAIRCAKDLDQDLFSHLDRTRTIESYSSIADVTAVGLE